MQQHSGNQRTLADLTLDAGQLAQGIASWDKPILFVRLRAKDAAVHALPLPPCPVVGLGDSESPLASRMDTRLEPGFDALRLAEQVMAQPMAASATAQLLRLLTALDIEQALCAESFTYAMLQGSAAHRDWIASRTRGKARSCEGRIVLSREDDVLTVTLDRAQAGNAIDRPMRDGLYEAFALANADETIRRVVLRGKGKAFSLGAELDEFGTTTDPATAHMIRAYTLPARQAARCADRIEAFIDGACIGAGLELAAFASRVTATRRAWFQLPELAMGILPGAGGCVSLSRRIGRQRTLLMILSGRRLSATLAHEWGLVDDLVDSRAVDQGAR